MKIADKTTEKQKIDFANIEEYPYSFSKSPNFS